MRNSALIVMVVLMLASISCRRGDKTKVVIEKSMAEKIELPQKVRVTADLKKIRDAIMAYQLLNEEYPSSIDDLGLDLYYPDDYLYDSEKGTVKSKSYPTF
jgi:hypothetical protein